MKLRNKFVLLIVPFLLAYFFVFYKDKNVTPSLAQSQPHENGVRSLDPSDESDGASRELQAHQNNQVRREKQSLSKTRLLDGEFEALATAAVSENVQLRNTSLNHLKELAAQNENIPALFDGLSSIASDHPSFAPIVAALAAVGTARIQGQLQSLLEQRQGDWRAYSAIVPAFAFLQEPTPSSVEFLSQLSRHPDPDYASTAALALGSIVRTLHVTQGSDASQLLRLHLDRLKNPSTPVDDLKETLAVLGNAGLEQSESRIVQLLSDGDAAIRADAALALRFLTSNSSELALISTLFSDEDGEVRLRVIDALIHRPVSEAGMAAVRQLISSPRSVPLELKEKALDLFLHAELSADQKQFNSEWIKQRIAIEAESSVKNKLITLLHMMSNSVAH